MPKTLIPLRSLLCKWSGECLQQNTPQGDIQTGNPNDTIEMARIVEYSQFDIFVVYMNEGKPTTVSFPRRIDAEFLHRELRLKGKKSVIVFGRKNLRAYMGAKQYETDLEEGDEQ